MSILDLLKVFYNTRSDNNILKHSTHTLKIIKNNSTNINTIKQSMKHKQQTSASRLHTKKVNENIQSTTDEYTLFISPNKNQKNAKLYNQKNKQSHKIKATSLKEDKINNSVSKLLTTVTEDHMDSKKTAHYKLKEYALQHNSKQKISENYSMFSINK